MHGVSTQALVFLKPGEALLSSYRDPEAADRTGAAFPGDTLAAVSMSHPFYHLEGTLGIVLTNPTNPRGLVELDSCYVASQNDHYLVAGDRTCGGWGPVFLGSMGWAYDLDHRPSELAALLYQCWDAAHTDHFTSAASDCDGHGRPLYPLGYVLQ